MELWPAINEPAAQDDRDRTGELAEVGSRIGVVDDGVSGGAWLKTRPA
jgi:hypothetical protein